MHLLRASWSRVCLMPFSEMVCSACRGLCEGGGTGEVQLKANWCVLWKLCCFQSRATPNHHKHTWTLPGQWTSGKFIPCCC
jgi:hypothetical protein